MNDSSSLWNYNNTVPKVDFTNPDELIRANGAAEAATEIVRAAQSAAAVFLSNFMDDSLPIKIFSDFLLGL